MALMFDYQCHTCGHIFEVLYMKSSERVDVEVCPKCNRQSAGQIWIKAPGMQPDPYWAGVNTPNGYVTSKSQLKQHMQEQGQRFYERGVEKDAENAKKARMESWKKERRSIIENGVKHLEVPRQTGTPKSFDYEKALNSPVQIEMTDVGEPLKIKV